MEGESVRVYRSDQGFRVSIAGLGTQMPRIQTPSANDWVTLMSHGWIGLRRRAGRCESPVTTYVVRIA
jgi:hypothetical protein